jgi:hypothetical protein
MGRYLGPDAHASSCSLGWLTASGKRIGSQVAEMDFDEKTGCDNPNKLFADDIAATIMAALEMNRRALWPELAVFANNPWKEG